MSATALYPPFDASRMIKILRPDKAWNPTISRSRRCHIIAAPHGMSEIEATDGDELQYHFGFGEISETKVLGDNQSRCTGAASFRYHILCAFRLKTVH